MQTLPPRVGLIGALSNHQLQASISRLAGKLGASPQSARTPPDRYALRRRLSSITAAILATLSPPDSRCAPVTSIAP